MTATNDIQNLIMHRATASDIERQAQTEGLVTLRQQAATALANGLTTPEELIRVLQ